MSLEQPASGRPFTGRHMLVLIVGFFGVVIAVNITMAVVASTSWTGLVVQNSYVASQEFEEKRLAHAAQRAAGWTAKFDYAAGTARIVVSDAAGNPVPLTDVAIAVNRPVGGHDDQVLALAPAAGGYAASLDLAPGIWEALVSAGSSLGPFELHSRFRVGDSPK